MSERFKYSLNGVYRCENFAQLVEHDNFPRVPIGSAGGVNGWFITLRRTNNQNDNPTVHYWIFATYKPTLRLHAFFNVIKKDGSSCFQKRGCWITAPNFGPYGEDMKIADLLNQDNGYLDDDGGLTVEYGIHVDAILGDDGIWQFNFEDQHFDGEENSIRWKLQARTLHSHKQFFNIDTLEVQVPNEFNIDAMKMFLQVAHGVRFHLDSYWLLRVIEIAHHYKHSNVIRYCENHLIEDYQSWFTCKSTIRIATEKKSNRWMGHCLRSVKCVKDIDWDIENMSGEAMKMLAARIFKFEK